MSDFSPFFPAIYQRAQGVSEVAASQAIRDAAIEFCERTRLWKVDVSLSMDAATKAFVPPTDSVLHDIEYARFDGYTIEPKSTQWLDDHVYGWRAGVSGQPQYLTQTLQDTFTVVPYTSTGTLIVSARLRPSETATTLPDFIANRYRQIIQYGALARLLLLPGQPFMNPDMAAYNQGLFNQQIDSLIAKSISGQQKAAIRTKARYF